MMDGRDRPVQVERIVLDGVDQISRVHLPSFVKFVLEVCDEPVGCRGVPLGQRKHRTDADRSIQAVQDELKSGIPVLGEMRKPDLGLVRTRFEVDFAAETAHRVDNVARYRGDGIVEERVRSRDDVEVHARTRRLACGDEIGRQRKEYADGQGADVEHDVGHSVQQAGIEPAYG